MTNFDTLPLTLLRYVKCFSSPQPWVHSCCC